MTGYQYIGIVAIGMFLLVTLLAMGTRRIGRMPGLAWTVIWLCGIGALIVPDATTSLANAVGIHRGADLLLYVVVIIMTIGFFSMYLRLRQLRREFTLLVRRISIMDARSSVRDQGSD